VVLVVPDLVRACALLVYKQLPLHYVRNLCHPEQRYAQQGFYFIGNDLARIHALAVELVGYLQVQERRGYGKQVIRVGKEIPGLFERHG
jgi:hypothetical protein